MNKKIIVLNGAARKNGNTSKLIDAFTDGAKAAGNQVNIFYLDGADRTICGIGMLGTRRISKKERIADDCGWW